MSSIEFNNLSIDDRAEVLGVIGTYLDGIVYYGYPRNLYSFGNLFVEARLSKDSGKIEAIEIIAESDLNKYLNKIQLSL